MAELSSEELGTRVIKELKAFDGVEWFVLTGQVEVVISGVAALLASEHLPSVKEKLLVDDKGLSDLVEYGDSDG